MGRNNQQRRAAKKRERDRRRKAQGPGDAPRRGQPSGGWQQWYARHGQHQHDVASPGTDPTGPGLPFADGPGDDGDLPDDPFRDDDPWDDDHWFGDPWFGDPSIDDPDVPYGDGLIDDENPGGDGESSEGADGGALDVPALMSVAAARPGTVPATRALGALIAAGHRLDVRRDATAVLSGALDLLYERGWQPADLVHVAGKKLDSLGQLVLSRIIQHDATTRCSDLCAPGEWLDQIRAIDDTLGPLPEGVPTPVDWLVGAGRHQEDAWSDLIGALVMMTSLPLLQVLLDPPSRWPRGGDEPSGPGPSQGNRHRRDGCDGVPGNGSASSTGPGSAGPAGTRRHDPKMLARIRALLAKAESTEFPQEAEALTGKAQALMSRYAIDEAVLDDGASRGSHASDVRARRVHVESPYASAKVQLLAAVGTANRVRVIWLGEVDIATAVGFPLELDLVEMLYTSLLVQATRAMTEAGRATPGDRSKSFRRAFLLAYAQRIGERLARASADETADAAGRNTGAEVVLARRSREVDDEFDRLFPRSRKMRSTRVDARGWYAGRDAADRATIARGRLDSAGEP